MPKPTCKCSEDAFGRFSLDTFFSSKKGKSLVINPRKIPVEKTAHFDKLNPVLHNFTFTLKSA